MAPGSVRRRWAAKAAIASGSSPFRKSAPKETMTLAVSRRGWISTAVSEDGLGAFVGRLARRGFPRQVLEGGKGGLEVGEEGLACG